MNTEDLIPKFVPGERVIYHDQPIEFACPHCGIGYSEGFPVYDYEATVISGKTGDLICLNCGKTTTTPDGWYRIRVNGELPEGVLNSIIAVPYTLLERVEVSR